MNFPVSAENLSALQQYLREKNWIAPVEELMSVKDLSRGTAFKVIRVRSSFRSFIIKQEVESISSGNTLPPGRIINEGLFYDLVQLNAEMREFTPEITAIDRESNLIMLEYFAEAVPFFDLFRQGRNMNEADGSRLVRFMSILHNQFVPPPNHELSNHKMRLWYAREVFQMSADRWQPANSVGKDDSKLIRKILSDQKVKAKLASLSNLYLSEGPHLTHGGFRPYAWLKVLDKVKVISPNYCAFNRAEFDLGNFMGNLKLVGHRDEQLSILMNTYQRPKDLDDGLIWAIAGAEILRCLLFPVFLPIELTKQEKSTFLEEAVGWIKN